MTFLLLTFILFQTNNLSFLLESKTVSNGKLVVVKAEIFYKYDEGKMITRYFYPAEMISITNNKGEASLYDPKSNTVILKRGAFFSTENDQISLFLQERYSDLGLKDLGYKMISQKKDKGYIVTEWIPQKKQVNDVSDKITLAHANDLPAYMALYSNGKCIRKIYYSDFTILGSYYLPSRITEIAYIKSDSVVMRKEYTRFKLGVNANSPYFSFTIPSDAKVINSNK